MPRRPAWKKALRGKGPLLLPAAHDGLTARLIEDAGFRAFQVGGFAIEGARHGYPDIDLTHFGEMRAAVRDILEVSTLPVLVDCDDGYGDVKNVWRTVRGYEVLGVSALFIEDQAAPKRCGHMAGKSVIPVEDMEAKLRAAAAARENPDTFLLARTDALAPKGVDEALRRGERYLKCGADGVYVEGPRTVEELQRVGRAFKGTPLATSILERGGKTPWLPPAELYQLGFTMLLYPATVLFRVTRATQRALADLKSGKPLSPEDSVDMDEFEDIVHLPEWEEVQNRFPNGKK